MPASELDQIFERLRALFANEYKRGERDGIKRFVADAQARLGPELFEAEKLDTTKLRTRNGAPEAFVRRVLSDYRNGLTPREIVDHAATPEERTISRDAVRVVMWRSKKKGWATSINGKWSLTQEEKN